MILVLLVLALCLPFVLILFRGFAAEPDDFPTATVEDPGVMKQLTTTFSFQGATDKSSKLNSTLVCKITRLRVLVLSWLVGKAKNTLSRSRDNFSRRHIVFVVVFVVVFMKVHPVTPPGARISWEIVTHDGDDGRDASCC